MEYQYKAFISYCHCDRDSAAANALHTAIETYIIPRKFRVDGKKLMGTVFLDKAEMSMPNELDQSLMEVLDASEFLIVICSPNSAQSPWVRLEVEHFLSNHTPDKLLLVVTGGEPMEIIPAITGIQPVSLHPGDEAKHLKKIYMDLCSGDESEMLSALNHQFLILCAQLLGCNFGELSDRHEKRRRQKFYSWIAGITAVASVIIGILLWSNRQISGKNEELAQINGELAHKNEELSQSNNEILLRESALLTQEALDALENGDRAAAVRHAVDALPSPEHVYSVVT